MNKLLAILNATRTGKSLTVTACSNHLRPNCTPFRAAVLLLTAACLSPINPASANTNIVLKVPEITGESLLDGFEKQIAIDSWGWGVQRNDSIASQQLPGRAIASALVVSKRVDRSSPELATRLFTSARIGGDVILSVLTSSNNAEPEAVTIVTMRDVVVSSISTTGATGDDPLRDTISFRFRCVEITTTTVDSRTGERTNNPVVRWDFATNRPECSE